MMYATNGLRPPSAKQALLLRRPALSMQQGLAREHSCNHLHHAAVLLHFAPYLMSAIAEPINVAPVLVVASIGLRGYKIPLPAPLDLVITGRSSFLRRILPRARG